MSNQLIFYDASREVGSTEEDEQGRLIKYVSPQQYYVAMLDHVMNVTVVFLAAHAADDMTGDELKEVDDAIAEAYWEKYLGCLTPPRVMHTLREQAEAGSTGELMLEEVESARQELFDAPTLEDAADVHASFRVQFLDQGADGYLTDYQVAVGEIMADYLLLQRAIAEDVRRAEDERLDDQPRAEVLEEMDRSAELEFETMLSKVLRPNRVVDMIPGPRRSEIEEFAKRRRQLFREGVLTTPEEATEAFPA